MAQDSRAAVLRVQELVHEQMHSGTERVQRKIADIFGEREQRKRCAEGEVQEGWLVEVSPSAGLQARSLVRLTSIATAGRNISTASAWNDLRLAFTLSVGNCLSAASNKSVATAVLFDKCGRLCTLGKLDRLGKLMPSDMTGSGVGVGGVLGSLPLMVFAFALGRPASLEACGVALESPAMLNVARCLYRRDRASCLFQVATLMLPRADQ